MPNTLESQKIQNSNTEKQKNPLMSELNCPFTGVLNQSHHIFSICHAESSTLCNGVKAECNHHQQPQEEQTFLRNAAKVSAMIALLLPAIARTLKATAGPGCQKGTPFSQLQACWSTQPAPITPLRQPPSKHSRKKRAQLRTGFICTSRFPCYTPVVARASACSLCSLCTQKAIFSEGAVAPKFNDFKFS